MKLSMLLTVAVLSVGNVSARECIFGTSTDGWNNGDYLTNSSAYLALEPRFIEAKDIPSLSKSEISMIQQVVSFVEKRKVSKKEALKKFTKDLGGGSIQKIVYVHDIYPQKENLSFVSYLPGDNEYGLVFQESLVDGPSLDLNYQVVAEIADSTVYNCKLFN